MRLLILLPAVLLPAASAAAPPVVSSAPERQAVADMPVIDPGGATAESCPPISRYHAQQRNPRPEAQRLNELPMADHYKTAYRRIDGCETPIIASFGAGGAR